MLILITQLMNSTLGSKYQRLFLCTKETNSVMSSKITSKVQLFWMDGTSSDSEQPAVIKDLAPTVVG